MTIDATTSNEDLGIALALELGELERGQAAVFLELTPARAVVLLALLQNAIKLGCVGNDRDVAEDVIQRIRNVIERGPAMSELIRRGEVQPSPSPPSVL